MLYTSLQTLNASGYAFPKRDFKARIRLKEFWRKGKGGRG